jgi:Ca2+-binding EF-hand superfamily protein
MGESNTDATGFTTSTATTHAPVSDSTTCALVWLRLHVLVTCLYLELMRKLIHCYANAITVELQQDMDPRNFTKIVLRKIREQFKDVWIQMVHNDVRSTGSISADDLRQVFYRLNVVMPDQHFDELVANFSDSAGGFLYKKFMAWVRSDF